MTLYFSCKNALFKNKSSKLSNFEKIFLTSIGEQFVTYAVIKKFIFFKIIRFLECIVDFCDWLYIKAIKILTRFCTEIPNVNIRFCTKKRSNRSDSSSLLLRFGDNRTRPFADCYVSLSPLYHRTTADRGDDDPNERENWLLLFTSDIRMP